METIEQAEWQWLKPHLSRDALIIVNSSLELLKVSEEMTKNNSNQIQEWIRTGLLSKPTLENVKDWDQTEGKRFNFLIVQPYVLIQEVVLH